MRLRIQYRGVPLLVGDSLFTIRDGRRGRGWDGEDVMGDTRNYGNCICDV